MTNDQQPPDMKTLDQVFESWNQRCLKELEDKDELSNAPTPSTSLRQDSQSFFSDLTNEANRSNPVFKDGNIRIETKSPHEIALAKLIQDLGPAFTHTNHESRYRALHVLVGAIQGCKVASFSNTMIQLVGGFLLKHCGPIDDDDYGEDYDSMIRNTAIHGLIALVQLSTSSTVSDEDISKAFEVRLQFAQEGIEMRCAVPSTMVLDSYGIPPEIKDMREQLSTLPRSKRSLCFELIGSAIQGVAAIIARRITSTKLQEDYHKSGLKQKLVAFARFTSSCLHGESDPRCLQQLLTLFHDMQKAFEHFFLESSREDLVFPSEDLFDAVAPYFPIQFTPPPNNVHGVTREGLNSALLAVLCYTEMDKNAIKHKRMPMINLSIGLFLEQLVPMDGEEPLSTLDKLEASECLLQLLFSDTGTSMVRLLNAITLRNLWNAIKRTHDESSMEIDQVGVEGANNKRLADHCRTLVSRLALELEMLADKSLWDAFVSEPLLKQKQKIIMSPSQCKLTIAYIACLTASGGPRTMRFCLGIGFETLLDHLTENLEDTEDVAAAIHGIGAFFSSCQVAISRGKKEGIVFHPHPLEQYATKASKVLLDAVEGKDLSMGIKIGATRALEFLVLAVSEEQVGEELVARLCSFIEMLLQNITKSSPDDNACWIETCCSALGAILGNAVNQVTTDDTSSTVLTSGAIQKLVKEVVSPELLQSTKSNSQTESSVSKKAIAAACTLSKVYSIQTVASVLESLKSSLENGVIDDSCIQCSEVLSYLFRNGGDVPIRAFHESTASAAILRSLGATRITQSARAETMANLSLPKEERKEDIKTARAKVHVVLSNLLPAYENGVPIATLVKLNSDVANILPPLSEADRTTLSTTLPILGSALGSLEEFPTIVEDSDVDPNQPSLQEVCIGMLPGLTEFILTADYDDDARSSAAMCMHIMLSLGNLGVKECPAKLVVEDLVKRYTSTTFDHSAIIDWLNFLSLMASSAARRGGSSSNTAGKVAQFLAEVATAGRAQLPFTSDDDNQLDLYAVKGTKIISTLQVVAASAYGSIIATDAKPLMKQRLTHTCLKHVKEAYKEDKSQAQAENCTLRLNVGILILISHLICSVDLSKMDRITLNQIAVIMVEGLSSSELFDPNAKFEPRKTTSKNLVLVAILKLVSIVPQSIPAGGYLLALVTGLLQAYAVSDPSSEISSKLLALQGLVALTNLEGAKRAVSAIQPAVVSVLGPAVNHPSGMLRQAAVDVRNAWYLVEQSSK